MIGGCFSRVVAHFFSGRETRLALVACLPLAIACTAEQQEQSNSTAASVPEASADLVIVGGTLLDMVSEEPNARPISALVVRDGKIIEIIDGDDDAVPPAAQTISAESLYISPGLIDAHVHFRPWLPDARISKRTSIYYGITTIFDTGPCGDPCADSGQDANEWISSYKQQLNSALVPDGPTLYMTGRRIQDLNGEHPLGEKLGSRSEIVAYLDKLVGMGVDGVKVESSLPADLRAIVVEEAASRGLPVVGHSRDAHESIEAGMKFIEHMWPIASSTASQDPGEKFRSPQHDYLIDMGNAADLIRSMTDSGVYVNPTLFGRYGYFSESMRHGAAADIQMMQPGGLYSDMPEQAQAGVRDWWSRSANLDADQLRTFRQSLASVGEFLRRFSHAGGRVLAATDSSDDKLIGISMHREMKLLADAGIEPYRIFLGATRWPAEMIYKDDAIGTIEIDKQADIVIFGSDPTANIDNSRDIRYVIKRGTILRRPKETPTT